MKKCTEWIKINIMKLDELCHIIKLICMKSILIIINYKMNNLTNLTIIQQQIMKKKAPYYMAVSTLQTWIQSTKEGLTWLICNLLLSGASLVWSLKVRVKVRNSLSPWQSNSYWLCTGLKGQDGRDFTCTSWNEEKDQRKIEA